MANYQALSKRVHELLDITLKACEDLDTAGKGISNYIPGKDSKEMALLCLNLFNMYIAISDGKLNEKEVKLINEIANTHFSEDELKQVIASADVRNEKYAEQIPIILRSFVDADNFEDKSAGGCPLSVVLYDLFATSGVYVMAVDETIGNDEYGRLMAYLQTIYKFMKQNLKYGHSDAKKPEDMIKSVLDDAELKINNIDISDINKKETEKTGDSDVDETTLEELIDELNSMIGLDEVKYEVTSLMNLLRIKSIRQEMGLDMPPVSMHLVFSGNPGTGKTSVARLLAKIYYKIGVLSKGQLVEVDRSGLVGGYVGQTAIKVSDVIKAAMGGVLFIDEAYSLVPENVVNDYGLEAVDTLVKSMEDHRDDLVVIVAGYPDLMNRFINSNPGLKSRFNKYIFFRDYTPQELTEIFLLFCKKHGYRASRPALEYVRNYFVKRCMDKEENFANAREVRNLFEYALSRQANRVILISNPTQNDITLIKEADVAGESIDLGKQQYMAQMVINDLTREKRHGIGMEYMDVNMDEFELSAGAEGVLYRNQIGTVREVLDYIDSGKTIHDINGMSEDIANEIINVLSEIGFEE